MSELLCTELSSIPAVSTRLHDDLRRLGTYLEQEERFMPTTYHMQKKDLEEQRQQMLEIIYEVRRHNMHAFLYETQLSGGWYAVNGDNVDRPVVKLYEGYHGIGECVSRAGAILILCVFATWSVEYLSQSCSCWFFLLFFF